MGNTTSDQRAPYEERFSLALLLPRYLMIGQMALIGGFGMAIMSVLGVMHYADLPSNPFAAYADVLPGQPSSAVEAHGFTCQSRDDTYSQAPSEIRCGINPETGAFSHVEAVSSHGLIHQLNFEIHANTFSMGDLAVLLELTEIHPYGSVFFSWHGKVGIAQTVKRFKHFSVRHNVWQVTLTDTPLHTP